MSEPEKPSKSSLLLNWHRETVKTSTGMSPAILLGSSFALAMGLFSWIGHSVDMKYGSEPWGVLAGVAVGLLYGVYEVWKVTRPIPDPPKKPDASAASETTDTP